MSAEGTLNDYEREVIGLLSCVAGDDWEGLTELFLMCGLKMWHVTRTFRVIEGLMSKGLVETKRENGFTMIRLTEAGKINQRLYSAENI